MNHRPWINFKELRARLQFDDVLRHYNVEVRSKGEQHHGPCPLPGHTGSKSAPSFSANLKRGIFQCFGCGAKGNVLEFAAFMENADVKDGDALRKVAVSLQERFFPEGASTRKKAKPAAADSIPRRVTVQTSLPVLVNQPIDFELKGLDRSHEYFANHGITIETAQHFGIGFCSRGILAGRIAIPLHDAEGRLIGYAGQAVNSTSINNENPLYRFPTTRERDGKVLEFDKTAYVYNGHRISDGCDELIVVEDFSSVWWLNQCGFPHAIALPCSECTPEQVDLIVSLVIPEGKIVLMSNDQRGISVLVKVLPYRFARWLQLSKDEKPTDLSREQINLSLKF